MTVRAWRKQGRKRPRYLKATHEATAQGQRWANAPDATRLFGHDWRCTPVVALDAQLWEWVVLVALWLEILTFDTMLHLLKTLCHTLLRTCVFDFSEVRAF